MIWDRDVIDKLYDQVDCFVAEAEVCGWDGLSVVERSAYIFARSVRGELESLRQERGW